MSKSSKDIYTKLIRMEATFELANSHFEWLEHDKAQARIDELIILVSQLQDFGILPANLYECEKYILAEATQHYIASEREQFGSPEIFYEFISKLNPRLFLYEITFIQLRYGETLYFRDIAQGLDIARNTMCSLQKLQDEHEKFYLWAKMDCAFLEFILTEEKAKILKMRDAHESLRKDFYNDYRKRSFAMASCYFLAGLVDEGVSYLFGEFIQARELRPRQKAFYFETLAVYELLNGHVKEAITALDEAGRLFHQMPSYYCIIAHNRKIADAHKFNPTKVEFCKNGQLSDPSCYYLDPRCIW